MSFYKQLFAVMFATLFITANVYAEEEFTISITGPDEVAPAPAPARTPAAPRTQNAAPATVAGNQNAPGRNAAPAARPQRPAATTPATTTPAAMAQQGRNQAAPARAPATQTPAAPANQVGRLANAPQGMPQAQQPQAGAGTGEGAGAGANRPAGLPPQFMAQHVVAPRETIWSIAHRYSAPYPNVNEFQAVASIYRNNRNAFDNDNVNNVRRGATLNIPVAEEMALELTSTGSELLSRGTTTLPPLDRSSLLANNQGTGGQNINVGQNMGPVAGSDNPLLPPLSDGTPVQVQTPTFVARETMLRAVPPVYTAPEGSFDNPHAQVLTDEQLAAQNASRTQESVPQLSSSSLDLHAIEQLLDKTERNIQTAQQDIYQRLDNNIQRSAQVARSTAEAAAKEEVGALINQYEQIIAQLQQSNADLRSSLSRINSQVEQIRGMQIETADSVAALGQRVTDGGPVAGEVGGNALDRMSLESGPVMWILLAFGLIALLLSIGLFIFKSKMRRERANRLEYYDDDEGDFVDDDDMEMSELLSRSSRSAAAAAAAAPVAEAAAEAPKKEEVHDAPPPIIDEGPVHDDGGFDTGFDNSLGDFADDSPAPAAPAAAQPKGTKLPDYHDEIVMPRSAPISTPKTSGVGAAAAGAAAGAAATLAAGAAMSAAPRPAPAVPPRAAAPAAPAAPVMNTPEDEAQAAWDSVATNASTALDKSVANAAGDDWAKSLDEKEASASQVDLGGGDFGADSGSDFGAPDAGGDFGADAGAGGDFGDLGADAGGFGDAGDAGAGADAGFGDLGGDAGGFGDAAADTGADGGFGDLGGDAGGFGDVGGDAGVDGGFGDLGGDTGGFGDAADAGSGADDGFGDLGGDAGGFGDGSGDAGGFGDLGGDAGGFGDDGGFGDAGGGDFGSGFDDLSSGGFGDELGGDDAKQFAASMQNANGGDDFPKTKALASNEVDQASAVGKDQASSAPAAAAVTAAAAVPAAAAVAQKVAQAPAQSAPAAPAVADAAPAADTDLGGSDELSFAPEGDTSLLNADDGFGDLGSEAPADAALDAGSGADLGSDIDFGALAGELEGSPSEDASALAPESSGSDFGDLGADTQAPSSDAAADGFADLGDLGAEAPAADTAAADGFADLGDLAADTTSGDADFGFGDDLAAPAADEQAPAEPTADAAEPQVVIPDEFPEVAAFDEGATTDVATSGDELTAPDAALDLGADTAAPADSGADFDLGADGFADLGATSGDELAMPAGDELGADSLDFGAPAEAATTDGADTLSALGDLDTAAGDAGDALAAGADDGFAQLGDIDSDGLSEDFANTPEDLAAVGLGEEIAEPAPSADTSLDDLGSDATTALNATATGSDDELLGDLAGNEEFANLTAALQNAAEQKEEAPAPAQDAAADKSSDADPFAAGDFDDEAQALAAALQGGAGAKDAEEPKATDTPADDNGFAALGDIDELPAELGDATTEAVPTEPATADALGLEDTAASGALDDFAMPADEGADALSDAAASESADAFGGDDFANSPEDLAAACLDELPTEAQEAADIFGGKKPEDMFATPEDAALLGDLDSAEPEAPVTDLADTDSKQDLLETPADNAMGFEDDEAESLAKALGQAHTSKQEQEALASAEEELFGDHESTMLKDNNPEDDVFAAPDDAFGIDDSPAISTELNNLHEAFNPSADISELAQEAMPQAAAEEAKDLASVLGTSLEDAQLQDLGDIERDSSLDSELPEENEPETNKADELPLPDLDSLAEPEEKAQDTAAPAADADSTLSPQEKAQAELMDLAHEIASTDVSAPAPRKHSESKGGVHDLLQEDMPPQGYAAVQGQDLSENLNQMGLGTPMSKAMVMDDPDFSFPDPVPEEDTAAPAPEAASTDDLLGDMPEGNGDALGDLGSLDELPADEPATAEAPADDLEGFGDLGAEPQDNAAPAEAQGDDLFNDLGAMPESMDDEGLEITPVSDLGSGDDLFATADAPAAEDSELTVEPVAEAAPETSAAEPESSDLFAPDDLSLDAPALESDDGELQVTPAAGAADELSAPSPVAEAPAPEASAPEADTPAAADDFGLSLDALDDEPLVVTPVSGEESKATAPEADLVPEEAAAPAPEAEPAEATADTLELPEVAEAPEALEPAAESTDFADFGDLDSGADADLAAPEAELPADLGSDAEAAESGSEDFGLIDDDLDFVNFAQNMRQQQELARNAAKEQEGQDSIEPQADSDAASAALAEHSDMVLPSADELAAAAPADVNHDLSEGNSILDRLDETSAPAEASDSESSTADFSGPSDAPMARVAPTLEADQGVAPQDRATHDMEMGADATESAAETAEGSADAAGEGEDLLSGNDDYQELDDLINNEYQGVSSYNNQDNKSADGDMILPEGSEQETPETKLHDDLVNHEADSLNEAFDKLDFDNLTQPEELDHVLDDKADEHIAAAEAGASDDEEHQLIADNGNSLDGSDQNLDELLSSDDFQGVSSYDQNEDELRKSDNDMILPESGEMPQAEPPAIEDSASLDQDFSDFDLKQHGNAEGSITPDDVSASDDNEPTISSDSAPAAVNVPHERPSLEDLKSFKDEDAAAALAAAASEAEALTSATTPEHLESASHDLDDIMAHDDFQGVSSYSNNEDETKTEENDMILPEPHEMPEAAAPEPQDEGAIEQALDDFADFGASEGSIAPDDTKDEDDSGVTLAVDSPTLQSDDSQDFDFLKEESTAPDLSAAADALAHGQSAPAAAADAVPAEAEAPAEPAEPVADSSMADFADAFADTEGSDLSDLASDFAQGAEEALDELYGDSDVVDAPAVDVTPESEREAEAEAFAEKEAQVDTEPVDVEVASPTETEVAHEVELESMPEEQAESLLQEAKIAPEDSADSDAPSMWSVPQDDFDITHVSGAIEQPQETSEPEVAEAEPAAPAESEPDIAASDEAEPDLMAAGFTTSSLDDLEQEAPAAEAPAEPAADTFGDDELDFATHAPSGAMHAEPAAPEVSSVSGDSLSDDLLADVAAQGDSSDAVEPSKFSGATASDEAEASAYSVDSDAFSTEDLNNALGDAASGESSAFAQNELEDEAFNSGAGGLVLDKDGHVGFDENDLKDVSINGMEPPNISVSSDIEQPLHDGVTPQELLNMLEVPESSDDAEPSEAAVAPAAPAGAPASEDSSADEYIAAAAADAVSDVTSQDEEDEHFVENLMEGDGQLGVDLNHEQALAQHDKSVKDMITTKNSGDANAAAELDVMPEPSLDGTPSSGDELELSGMDESADAALQIDSGADAFDDSALEGLDSGLADGGSLDDFAGLDAGGDTSLGDASAESWSDADNLPDFGEAPEIDSALSDDSLHFDDQDLENQGFGSDNFQDAFDEHTADGSGDLGSDADWGDFGSLDDFGDDSKSKQ